MFAFVLAALIPLSGVVGDNLRARAFFDANNVKVGDPLVLTLDFLGSADFKSLHPPALARNVNRKDWKLDDASAKTDTFRDARRLTYRIRPMREGLLYFPALEFEYSSADGARRVVRSNEIPVHAKSGAQVVVAEMGEDQNEMPSPPALVTEPGVALSDDETFAWRRACANPTSADAFAAFDFPAARLNEARLAILAGNWSRALSVYRRLEWITGQTKEIEAGIRAALSVRYDNPTVELPIWRVVGRPILKFAALGRCLIIFGGLALVVLLFWLIGRGIRAVAALAVLLLVLPVEGQGLFEQMERQMREMQERMQRMSGGFSFHYGEKEERTPPKITASCVLSKKTPQVGDGFDYIISLDVPRTCSLGQLSLTPSEMFGLTVTGTAQNLADAPSANPSNVVKRLSVPVRYDVPFKGKVSFRVQGMVTGRESRNGGRFSFTFSNSFACETPPVSVEIRPLPTAHQPADFAGLVSEGLRLAELPDILSVETNDVVVITYRLHPKGYVPENFLPPGAAFEWRRETDDAGHVTAVEYRRFFVADGAPATPRLSIPYYDPRTKAYRRAEAGGTRLNYHP